MHAETLSTQGKTSAVAVQTARADGYVFVARGNPGVAFLMPVVPNAVAAAVAAHVRRSGCGAEVSPHRTRRRSFSNVRFRWPGERLAVSGQQSAVSEQPTADR